MECDSWSNDFDVDLESLLATNEVEEVYNPQAAISAVTELPNTADTSIIRELEPAVSTDFQNPLNVAPKARPVLAQGAMGHPFSYRMRVPQACQSFGGTMRCPPPPVGVSFGSGMRFPLPLGPSGIRQELMRRAAILDKPIAAITMMSIATQNRLLLAARPVDPKQMITIRYKQKFNRHPSNASPIIRLPSVRIPAIKTPVDTISINSGDFAALATNKSKEVSSISSEPLPDNDFGSVPTFEISIVIKNVVSCFKMGCHLDLHEIGSNGWNVEYRHESAMVVMKLRKPATTAMMRSTGRVNCSGATSEELSKVASRRFSRMVQKLGFPVRFLNFRVVNVLAICRMPWHIRIVAFTEEHRNEATYEPELHPAVMYKLRDPKAAFHIFSTGSITIIAERVSIVQAAMEHLYPQIYEFRKVRFREDQPRSMQTEQPTPPTFVIAEANSPDIFDMPDSFEIPDILNLKTSTAGRKPKSQNKRAYVSKQKRLGHFFDVPGNDKENVKRPQIKKLKAAVAVKKSLFEYSAAELLQGQNINRNGKDDEGWNDFDLKLF